MVHAIERLTKRQKACLRLVGQGYTSKEIGRQIGISPVTVDNYVRDALSILQVATRAEAARMLLSATDQSLIGQPQALAGPAFSPQKPIPAGSPHGWRDLLFPPLGGTRNNLEFGGKWFAMIAVAVLGFASLVMLTLGVTAVMYLLR